MTETVHLSEELADAIEIISMCLPISDIQGGMWFGRNHNMADATFADYGACRAFAVAARALPNLVKLNMEWAKALEAVAAAKMPGEARRIAIDALRPTAAIPPAHREAPNAD
jgi:hypothetical protein